MNFQLLHKFILITHSPPSYHYAIFNEICELECLIFVESFIKQYFFITFTEITLVNLTVLIEITLNQNNVNIN